MNLTGKSWPGNQQVHRNGTHQKKEKKHMPCTPGHKKSQLHNSRKLSLYLLQSAAEGRLSDDNWSRHWSTYIQQNIRVEQNILGIISLYFSRSHVWFYPRSLSHQLPDLGHPGSVWPGVPLLPCGPKLDQSLIGNSNKLSAFNSPVQLARRICSVG